MNIRNIESRITQNRLKIKSLIDLEKLISIDKQLYLLGTDHVRLIDTMINACYKTKENGIEIINFNRKKVNELDKELLELHTIDLNKIKFERRKLRQELAKVKKMIEEGKKKKEERIKRTQMVIEKDQIEDK